MTMECVRSKRRQFIAIKALYKDALQAYLLPPHNLFPFHNTNLSKTLSRTTYTTIHLIPEIFNAYYFSLQPPSLLNDGRKQRQENENQSHAPRLLGRLILPVLGSTPPRRRNQSRRRRREMVVVLFSDGPSYGSHGMAREWQRLGMTWWERFAALDELVGFICLQAAWLRNGRDTR
jgi:hypothetical protein